MRRGTARMIVPVVMMLTLAACGGEDAPETATTGASSGASGLTVERIDAAATTIDEQWGERDGFAVVMLAADRGYAIDQIVEHPQIEGDGSIGGVEPAGPTRGLIEPAAGSGARRFGDGRSPANVLISFDTSLDGSPADAYVAFVDQSLGELFTAAQAHRDRQAREAAAAEAFEAEVSAIAMGLLARGYSLEHVIEAIVLSEWKLASLVHPCLYIPGAAPGGTDQMSSSCPPLSAGGGTSGGTETPAGQPAAGTGGLDGVYVNDEWPAPAGGTVVEVLEADIAVTVADGMVDGGIVWVVVVQSDDGVRVVAQRATQTIEFGGTVAPDGTYRGEGTTSVVYELMSCEPEDQCSGVTATRSAQPDGVAVTLTGTVRDGTFEAEIVNSVSGATRTFEAHRK